MDNNRNGAQPNKDMTQRVPLQNASRSSTPQRNSQKKWYMSPKEKAVVIALGSVALVLLLVLIIAVGALLWSSFGAQDNGQIMKGVMAAGVNLSGMTKDQARAELNKVAADYSQSDMVVSVLDTEIRLSPSATGAKLDVEAVVTEAYNYGRKNSASEGSITIDITKYLNLNTDYIRSEVNKLGAKFSTTLTQPTLTLTGTRPQLDLDNPDDRIYQTLVINKGTPEYGMDPNRLYSQVLEYYNIHVFKVEGTCSVQSPDSYEEELKKIYDKVCVAPIDAKLESGSITPHTYGYGFDLDAVKEQLANMPYGKPLTLQLGYLKPNVTKEDLSNATFQDMLGDDSAVLGTDEAWNTNVGLACQALNGTIIPAGNTFSFLGTLGELTAEQGYVEALAYLDRVLVPTMGGGVSHVASLLYTSALEAGLDITERHSHAYVPNFVSYGRDAYVDDVKDLRIQNNSANPVCIRAEVVEGELRVSIVGISERKYYTEVSAEIHKTIPFQNLYNYMDSQYVTGIVDGQVLVDGLDGYEIEVYVLKIDAETGTVLNKGFCTVDTYEARDAVVAKLLSETPQP